MVYQKIAAAVFESGCPQNLVHRTMADKNSLIVFCHADKRISIMFRAGAWRRKGGFYASSGCKSAKGLERYFKVNIWDKKG